MSGAYVLPVLSGTPGRWVIKAPTVLPVTSRRAGLIEPIERPQYENGHQDDRRERPDGSVVTPQSSGDTERVDALLGVHLPVVSAKDRPSDQRE